MILLASLLCLILGLTGGFFAREVYNKLKRIETVVRVLYARQKKEEQQEKKMGFADPINFEELTDAEKIDYLNM